MSEGGREGGREGVSKNSYRSWVILFPGLTDVLHYARIAAASDEHGLEGTGAVHEPFHDHGLRIQFRV